MDDRPNENAPEPASVKKKFYRKPVLQNFGTLEELTQSQGMTGKKDGGFLLWSKTR